MLQITYIDGTMVWHMQPYFDLVCCWEIDDAGLLKQKTIGEGLGFLSTDGAIRGHKRPPLESRMFQHVWSF